MANIATINGIDEDDIATHNGITASDVTSKNGDTWVHQLPFMTATGGTISTDGDYKVHVFNSSSNFVVSAVGSDGSYGNRVNILCIGGGGGGGSRHWGAGGGAGGW